MAGDALTDIDLRRAGARPTRQRRDRDPGGQAGRRRQRVRRHRHRHRRAGHGLSGEARSGRGALRPRQLHDLCARARDLRPLPRRDEVDFANDVFPALLEHDVPFDVHVTDSYWNDVGSLPEYLQGNFDVLGGAVEVEPAGKIVDSAQTAPTRSARGRGSRARSSSATGCQRRRRRAAPRPAGDRPRGAIGAGARVRESVLLPGAEVPRRRWSPGRSSAAAGVRD